MNKKIYKMFLKKRLKRLKIVKPQNLYLPWLRIHNFKNIKINHFRDGASASSGRDIWVGGRGGASGGGGGLYFVPVICDNIPEEHNNKSKS